MDKKIYLDYAATTPVLPEVSERMYEILKNDFGNPSSIHHYGRIAKTIVEDARKVMANYLGASIGEIFFTSGATESTHTIFYSSVNDLGIERIISSKVEHHCTLHTLEHLQKEKDIEVVLLDVEKFGLVNPEILDSELKKSSKKTLVTLMHGNNALGSLHDLSLIGNICEENDALFCVDTAQSFGKYKINVEESKINFLTASAHKLFAPKGTGVLYVKSDNIIKPLFHGGAQERNMRAGTENVHGIAGYATALQSALSEMEDRNNKLHEIKSYAIERLSEIDGVTFNGSIDPEYSMQHVLSVSFPPSEKSDMIMFNLDIAGICASSGSACSSGVEQDSHVLQAIGHDPKRKTIRFSFAHYTTKEEIDYLIETLKKVC